MVKKYIAKVYLWVLLLMLYAPIIIIAIFSFTEAKVLGSWTGFSTQLYSSLFTPSSYHSLSKALLNTLSIALISATVATFLGSMAAVGIYNMRHRQKRVITLINNIPILNANLITGVALFFLFLFLGVSQGYTTVVLAHITLCTPFVVVCVLPKLKKMNPDTYEAALDLGATPWEALRKVIFPEIRSGMITGFILAVMLSINDFIVTIFTIGNEGLETLSTYIYTDARKGGLTPELRPLITIILLVILVLLLVINKRTQTKSAKR